MGLLFGVMFLMVTWCLQLVWVARTAQSRGRSALVWSLIAGAAGGLGVCTGFLLANRLLGPDDAAIGLAATVGAMFAPVVAMVVPMVIVRTILVREPIKVADHGTWQVSFLGQGSGKIAVEHSQIHVDLAGERQILAPTRVEADGECVRITLADRELVALPLGKPDTPEGRRHQSLILAKRLRHANSLH